MSGAGRAMLVDDDCDEYFRAERAYGLDAVICFKEFIMPDDIDDRYAVREQLLAECLGLAEPC